MLFCTIVVSPWVDIISLDSFMNQGQGRPLDMNHSCYNQNVTLMVTTIKYTIYAFAWKIVCETWLCWSRNIFDDGRFFNIYLPRYITCYMGQNFDHINLFQTNHFYFYKLQKVFGNEKEVFVKILWSFCDLVSHFVFGILDW